ncbi:MAG TPA: hypothetical protein VE954_26520 [Oligoflexus sp.]|uniref:hypothetical protein n=1 Tax=Oligoflexus sp. TaxID=1971216 RepID=UPI002D319636|nr:hypothetical protein [Oligoflexus sp.]HYX36680.1 hypothetical protein [Oligoflexus sp.]
MKRWTVLILAQVAILVLILWPDHFTKLRILDILNLGSGYRAKELCTCLFVLERSEEACNDWTRDIALNAAYSVDATHKIVTSSYQWLGSALPLFLSTASYQDEKRGCLLLR